MCVTILLRALQCFYFHFRFLLPLFAPALPIWVPLCYCVVRPAFRKTLQALSGHGWCQHCFVTRAALNSGTPKNWIVLLSILGIQSDSKNVFFVFVTFSMLLTSFKPALLTKFVLKDEAGHDQVYELCKCSKKVISYPDIHLSSGAFLSDFQQIQRGFVDCVADQSEADFGALWSEFHLSVCSSKISLEQLVVVPWKGASSCPNGEDHPGL